MEARTHVHCDGPTVLDLREHTPNAQGVKPYRYKRLSSANASDTLHACSVMTKIHWSDSRQRPSELHHTAGLFFSIRETAHTNVRSPLPMAPWGRSRVCCQLLLDKAP
jgi:hypothetical protein